EITQYAGLTRISYLISITVLDTGKVADPLQISIPDIGEETEGSLVKLDSVWLVDIGYWPVPGGNGNIDITDGIDTIEMFIDKETDLDEWTTPPTGPMELIAASQQYTFSVPPDDGYQLRGTLRDHFMEIINEDIYIISTPEISTAVTNEGTIGMLNYRGGNPGFTWSGSANLLYEGALLIGRPPDHVVDAARAVMGGSMGPLDEDYQYLTNINVIDDNTDSTVLNTKFDDSRADQHPFADDGPNMPIGLEINQTTYCYTDSVNSGYVIYKLEVTNTTGSTIDEILIGSYFDWDIGNYNMNTGAVEFHSVQIPGVNGGNAFDAEFAYLYEDGVSNAFMGAVPLNQNYFCASRILHQPSEVYYANFSEANKVVYLSERRASDPYGPGGANADKGIMFGIGGGSGGAGTVPDSGFSIPAGDTVTIGFAIVGGDDVTDFVANGTAAMNKWVERGNDIVVFEYVTGMSEKEIADIPLAFDLKQNYPNPFNPSTKIKYDLPKPEKVKIEIFNLLGQKIETLINKPMSAGSHQVEFIAKELPSGVYYYRIQASGFQQVKKMVFLK
ncbi:MAG: T9SS type A sorting domain-containing protein, partial [Candidatus Hodarchaeales archaeon]